MTRYASTSTARRFKNYKAINSLYEHGTRRVTNYSSSEYVRADYNQAQACVFLKWTSSAKVATVAHHHSPSCRDPCVSSPAGYCPERQASVVRS